MRRDTRASPVFGSLHDKDNLHTWYDAAAVKMAALNSTSFGGHDDWRLPSLFELQTLLDRGTYARAMYSAFNTGCAAACTVTTCNRTVSSYYWSSTSGVPNATDAWFVAFTYGFVDLNSKPGDFYVRAVRGGS